MKTTLLIFLTSFFAVTTSFAKTPGDCHRELKEQCKDKKHKDRFECMRNGVANLDSECQKLINEKKEQFSAGGDHPCKADRDKCKDTGGGHALVMKCLLDKKAELSESCKKHIEEKMAKMPCFEDRNKYCKDVKVGEGRIHECLNANLDKLSPACKEKVSKNKKEEFDKED